MTIVNFCAVVRCGSRSNREKGTRFFCLPSVIMHQGEKTHNLSANWRDLWLIRIHREGRWEVSYTHVVLNTITGEPSDLYDETYPDKTIWRCSNEWMLDSTEETTI